MKKSLILLACVAMLSSVAQAQNVNMLSAGAANATTFGGTTSGFSSLNVNPLGFSLNAAPVGGTGSASTQSAAGAVQTGFAGFDLATLMGTQGGAAAVTGGSETTTSGVGAGASVYGAQAGNASGVNGNFVYTIPTPPVVNPTPVVVNPLITVTP